jgi:hypothetical protein
LFLVVTMEDNEMASSNRMKMEDYFSATSSSVEKIRHVAWKTMRFHFKMS